MGGSTCQLPLQWSQFNLNAQPRIHTCSSYSAVCSSFYKFHYSARHIPGVLNTAADALSRMPITDLSPFIPQIPTHEVPLAVMDQIPDWICLRGSSRAYYSRTLLAIASLLYRTGINRFIGFCHRFSIPPFPLSQTNICRFVAFLHAQSETCRHLPSGSI